MIKEYYALAKPGLVLGNLLTVVAGFALGAQGHIDLMLLTVTALGISLVMASGCVFNNFIDRDIDRAMERTKRREIVTGKTSLHAALAYGTLLGLLGFSILGIYTNPFATGAALFGFIFYVIIYSMWGKRRTVYGTAIGSLAGAVPPVVGYCAASGRFDLGAILLFVILALWQMPHFFAIGIYRLDDYKAAAIPILPVKRGIRTTKIAMLIYIILFGYAALSLSAFGYTGTAYFIVAVILCLMWLGLWTKGFRLDEVASKRWARKMFFFSLIVLTGLSIMIAVDPRR